jgi:predicted ATPase/DNA-binding winged helix-turn-helix (wHTH) protein
MDVQRDSEEVARAFGPYRLHPGKRLLLRGTQPVRIGSRAFELLLILVESPGKTVGKRELMARVWPTTVVEEGALRVHVAALRKLLGGGRGRGRYIESVTGQGYRFVASVTSPGDAAPHPDSVRVTADADLHKLPLPLTRAIGRANIVSTLTSRLAHRRLVTIVGPGGVGKTTVAIESANQLRDVYPDGVRFVELAPIAAPSALPTAVAAALALEGGSMDALANIEEHLRHKRVLLLVDNCEHLVDEVVLLAERLLRRLPGLRILATSREPLRAAGESVLRLPPLELPSSREPLTAAEAVRFPAIQLFCERATASVHTFELRDADVPVVMEICRRLDCLPLAIELAAARVSQLGVRGVCASLDDWLGLSTRGQRPALSRHRSLRATFDWSYGILSPAEQVALCRLAALGKKFDIDTATEVISLPNPLTLLADLAAKSFLCVHLDGDRVLYEMLDTVRGYALEKLDSSRDDLELDDAHDPPVRGQYYWSAVQ